MGENFCVPLLRGWVCACNDSDMSLSLTVTIPCLSLPLLSSIVGFACLSWYIVGLFCPSFPPTPAEAPLVTSRNAQQWVFTSKNHTSQLDGSPYSTFFMSWIDGRRCVPLFPCRHARTCACATYSCQEMIEALSSFPCRAISWRHFRQLLLACGATPKHVTEKVESHYPLFLCVSVALCVHVCKCLRFCFHVYFV